MASTQSAPFSPPAYRAFISYSHSDKAIATWLHTALERYRFPKKLVGADTRVGPVPAKLTPIFRDQDELPASGNLGAELQNALSRSLFLIVVCSPAAAHSKWVNEEIRQFKHLHGAERVLALVVDGIPNAAANEAHQECFPPALKFEVDANGNVTDKPSEPIAADMRSSADGKRLAKLKLIAGLSAVRLDALIQREASRRVRTLVQVSSASLCAAILAIGLAVYANNQRLEANAQQAIAEQESATAEAVSDFLVSTFVSANSHQSNPDDVTARSILDQGANRIAQELQKQPQVQVRLSTTIARAYNNLGLYNQAIDIIDTTVASSNIQHPSAVLIKAEAQRRKGEMQQAMQTAQLAGQLAEQLKAPQNLGDSAKLRADIASVQAAIHYQLGEHKPGLESFAKALQELERAPTPNRIEIANTLQNRAMLLSDIGEFAWAKRDLDKAMGYAVASKGEQHIVVARIALAQAQINFLDGNLESASMQIEFAIPALQRILGEDNPALADAYSMQGQIKHAQGQLDNAKQALQHAVSIYTSAYGGRHYLSGIAEVYLALIAGEQQNLEASLNHFKQAKQHYDASYGATHANHGDLLVNQATVLAAAGQITQAKQDCTDGMSILQSTLGKDAPFTRQLQRVCDEIAAR